MQPETNKDKWDLVSDDDEIFAMMFEDHGEPGLRTLLPMRVWVKEDLEDAALGLTDAGMHKAAKIVSDYAKTSPSEDDLEEVCPYTGDSNVRSWNAAKAKRLARRKRWRAEVRRRKRAGTW